MRDPEAFFSALLGMDAVLAQRGVPALTPRWREAVSRLYRRRARRIVIRAGRRSGKSMTMAKLAVAEMLYGGHAVPPGDVAWAIFVSTTVSEALARLHTIATYLDLLRVPYERAGNEIRVSGLPFGFRVLACNHKTAVGSTAFFLGEDEVSRWEADGTNPAAEVRAALLPMAATMPEAIEVVSSTPLSSLDLHFELCAEGDTNAQIVVEGASWDFNPTLTPERCRELARTEREFSREFQAIPMGAVSAAFDADDIDAAYRPLDVAWNYHQPIVAIDASSGRGDAFVGAVLGWIVPILPAEAWESEPLRDHRGTVVGAPQLSLDDQGRPVLRPEYVGRDRPMLRVHSLGAVTGKWGRLTLDQIVEAIAQRAHMFGARLVVGDQHLSAALEPAFRAHRLRYESIAWTNASKNEAVERLRWLLRDRAVDLSEGGDTLRRELLQFSERVTASGAITYAARGSAHDDHVAAVLTGCMADLDGLMKGSLGGGSYRRIHHLEERQR